MENTDETNGPNRKLVLLLSAPLPFMLWHFGLALEGAASYFVLFYAVMTTLGLWFGIQDEIKGKS